MSLPNAPESAAAQLRQARDEIEALKTHNARLHGALQEAIALAEQWGRATPESVYMLAPLKALAQTVISRSDTQR
jgi:hypothetical protein